MQGTTPSGQPASGRDPTSGYMMIPAEIMELGVQTTAVYMALLKRIGDPYQAADEIAAAFEWPREHIDGAILELSRRGLVTIEGDGFMVMPPVMPSGIEEAPKEES
jgi:hypothetical protein